MAVDWDAEVLAPMMEGGVFGENVQPLYQPQRGGFPFPIDGVFDNAFQSDVLLSDGTPEFVTVNPVLGVRLAQFQAQGVKPTGGDTVTIASVNRTYIVNEVKPDGHGWAKLELTTTGAP